MQVFGENRTRESAPILDDALRPLRRWKQLREPDENEAEFPRLDNAAKALDPTPSITTQSARNILADLCEWSEYDFEEPLKPHGARRGLGRELYRENPQLAQDVLRHKSSKQHTRAMHRRPRSVPVTKRTTSSAVSRYTARISRWILFYHLLYTVIVGSVSRAQLKNYAGKRRLAFCGPVRWFDCCRDYFVHFAATVAIAIYGPSRTLRATYLLPRSLRVLDTFHGTW